MISAEVIRLKDALEQAEAVSASLSLEKQQELQKMAETEARELKEELAISRQLLEEKNRRIEELQSQILPNCLPPPDLKQTKEAASNDHSHTDQHQEALHTAHKEVMLYLSDVDI